MGHVKFRVGRSREFAVDFLAETGVLFIARGFNRQREIDGIYTSSSPTASDSLRKGRTAVRPYVLLGVSSRFARRREAKRRTPLRLNEREL